MSNDQPIEESGEWIYSDGKEVRDPQEGEEGPHLKGKIPKGRIKDSKWENSTISLFNNNHLVVLEASSERSVCSIFGETS